VTSPGVRGCGQIWGGPGSRSAAPVGIWGQSLQKPKSTS